MEWGAGATPLSAEFWFSFVFHCSKGSPFFIACSLVGSLPRAITLLFSFLPSLEVEGQLINVITSSFLGADNPVSKNFFLGKVSSTRPGGY